MTPHLRPPDPGDTGRTWSQRPGGATGAGGIGVRPGSEADQIGGLPPGLVARVQRRLAATGAVATDADGHPAAVAETLSAGG
jgi:hypothetical protein